MICQYCKKNISVSSQFCSFCGKSQEKADTLEEIYERWRKVHYRKLSAKGCEGYDIAWRRLAPLALIEANQLEFEDFQKILDDMLPTSRSNQEKLQQLVGQLCKHSFLFGNGLRLNYAAYLILDGYHSKETMIFEDAEISKILGYAKNPANAYCKAARVTLCLIFTGLRPNELFNLKKEDVHINERFLIVGGSKTEAGRNRLIPLVDSIWCYVAEWYFAAKNSIQEKPGYLLSGVKGAKYSLSNWREREFYPLMLELNINKPQFYGQQRRTPYSCRHTYASLAYRAGVEKEILKKMIGHTNWAFTAKTYVHAQIEQFQQEADKIQLLMHQFE